MPPTANRQLQPVKMGRTARLIKTPDARAFDKELELYKKNGSFRFKKHHIDYLHEVLNQNPLSGLVVNCYFVFPKSKVISKANTIKKLDANNRLKSTLDAVSYLTEIDDSRFFTGICEKVICNKTISPYVIVTMEWTELRLSLIHI